MRGLSIVFPFECQLVFLLFLIYAHEILCLLTFFLIFFPINFSNLWTENIAALLHLFFPLTFNNERKLILSRYRLCLRSLVVTQVTSDLIFSASHLISLANCVVEINMNRIRLTSDFLDCLCLFLNFCEENCFFLFTTDGFMFIFWRLCCFITSQTWTMDFFVCFGYRFNFFASSEIVGDKQ